MNINDTKAPLIFIMGPTASGKTSLAIDLVQQAAAGKYQSGLVDARKASPAFEIISVDSAMVYTQMDIGSAKPSAKELKMAPHYLIDFIDPKLSYSVSQFRTDAISLINDIHQRGNVPLLVGGTMLYFKVLQEGLADMPQTDKIVRGQVKDDLDSKGLEHLHIELSKVDPSTASRLHINDCQRITRALEVFRMTGKPLSEWHAQQKEQTLINPVLSIALAPNDRKALHQRIEKRFAQMVNDGFLEEVSRLYHRGDLNLDCSSMRCVGYRQVWDYMDGKLSLDEAKERSVIATRQLAKRQYTWLRSWPNVHWYDPLDKKQREDCMHKIKEFIVSSNRV